MRGILPEAAIERLVERTLEHGGLVSYKSNPDGSRSPYELNISYFDALSDPAAALPMEEQVDRFMAAHAIMLSLIGVPGIYFHSLFGSRGWRRGVEITGRNRSINRQKLVREELEGELAAPGSRRRLVFNRIRELLACAQPARLSPIWRAASARLRAGDFCRSATSPEGRIGYNLPDQCLRYGAAGIH